jgi:hypothetical protein
MGTKHAQFQSRRAGRSLSHRYAGGCHCGAVRFEVDVEDRVAYDCNCSICQKKGFLHAIVSKVALRIQSGQAELSEYRFGTSVARHMFCRFCGIHPFYVPRSHPDGWDVNVRCLDGDALAAFRIEAFDGRDWENAVSTIRAPS